MQPRAPTVAHRDQRQSRQAACAWDSGLSWRRLSKILARANSARPPAYRRANFPAGNNRLHAYGIRHTAYGRANVRGDDFLTLSWQGANLRPGNTPPRDHVQSIRGYDALVNQSGTFDAGQCGRHHEQQSAGWNTSSLGRYLGVEGFGSWARKPQTKLKRYSIVLAGWQHVPSCLLVGSGCSKIMLE